jgi:hypothetical protein
MTLFTYLPAAALAAFLLIAVARAVILYRRGIRVVIIDAQPSLAEHAFDTFAFFLFVAWAWLVFDYADGRGPRWLPEGLAAKLIDFEPGRYLAVALLAGGVLLYLLALAAMGESWRLGIDLRALREPAAREPAALITRGVFARSRNPIYVAFNLIAWGAFLVHGTVVFLLAALALALVLHIQILREERFLAAAHGEPFADYRRRTRRYI